MFLPGDSPGPGEPGGLPSRGSHRVGHDSSDLAVAAAAAAAAAAKVFLKSYIVFQVNFKEDFLLE